MENEDFLASCKEILIQYVWNRSQKTALQKIVQEVLTLTFQGLGSLQALFHRTYSHVIPLP